MSQPALSAQIQRLERGLGVQLFKRLPRRVLVTSAGADVIERARRVLREVEDLVDAAENEGDPLAGGLRLGVIPTIAPYLLPKVLPKIREALPRLTVYLREKRTDVLVEKPLDGRLDLLLLALPLDGAGIEELPLFDEPFVMAVPSSHRLASRRRWPQSALVGEPLVMLEDGHCLRKQALDVCGPAGEGNPVELQGTSLSTVVQMVGSGLGITLLPQNAVPLEVRDGDNVVVTSFRAPVPTHSIGLAWRTTSARAEGYHALGEIVATAGRQ